jgi:hypothetical protein
MPDNFTWISDGSLIDLSFTHQWLSNSHNLESGEFCAGFDSAVGNKINDMYCLNKADFFCEFTCQPDFSLSKWFKEKTNEILEIDDAPRRECRKCRDGDNKGWNSYVSKSGANETCYKYMVTSLDFVSAKKYCLDRGTHLVTLEHPSKFADFQEKFKAEWVKYHSSSDNVKAWVK